MKKCSISAERSLVSLNMTCSPSLVKFDYDLRSILKKFKHSYLTHAKISFWIRSGNSCLFF